MAPSSYHKVDIPQSLTEKAIQALELLGYDVLDNATIDTYKPGELALVLDNVRGVNDHFLGYVIAAGKKPGYYVRVVASAGFWYCHPDKVSDGSNVLIVPEVWLEEPPKYHDGTALKIRFEAGIVDLELYDVTIDVDSLEYRYQLGGSDGPKLSEEELEKIVDSVDDA
ncbi:uncharacterized protein AB675_8602 [Cyphellophora attinorum]|uniref:Uncharacterized protein n=1 Tax=Cyphellophora attinorum TaxID=1664694 RepID=A0A0N0NQT0_9EURO|nr:uncharacterized protein AB675_8602 [Phialophora attinorum]KPI44281.1 hypothetical protein AB675_8602 [Phialophora attinorum]